MLDNASCNSCGGAMRPWLHMPIDAKKDEPTPYSSVQKCQRCGLGTLSPMPDAGAIAGLYDLEAYYTHGESHMPERKSSFADRLLIKLAWWADRSEPFDVATVAKTLPAGGRVCDLGCGHAHYLRQFHALGFSVVGVDPDPSARQEAANAGIEVLAGTAEDLPTELDGETFDLVIQTHALEHCRSVKRAVENAFRLTKPGGRCYIEVPNCDAEHFRTFTFCSEMFDTPRHIYFFTPTNLAELVKRCGFEVRQRLFSGYVRDFTPTWRGWEAEIADRVARFDPAVNTKRHALAASASLVARSFWRSPERKYDSFGLLLARPALD